MPITREFLPQSALGVEVTLDKDHGNLSLVGTQGREVGLVSVEHQTFTQT